MAQKESSPGYQSAKRNWERGVTIIIVIFMIVYGFPLLIFIGQGNAIEIEVALPEGRSPRPMGTCNHDGYLYWATVNTGKVPFQVINVYDNIITLEPGKYAVTSKNDDLMGKWINWNKRMEQGQLEYTQEKDWAHMKNIFSWEWYRAMYGSWCPPSQPDNVGGAPRGETSKMNKAGDVP